MTLWSGGGMAHKLDSESNFWKKRTFNKKKNFHIVLKNLKTESAMLKLLLFISGSNLIKIQNWNFDMIIVSTFWDGRIK